MRPHPAVVFTLVLLATLCHKVLSETVKGKVTRKASTDYNRHAVITFNINRKRDDKIIMTFKAFGKKWRLSLRRNNMLFAEGFSYVEKDMQGKKMRDLKGIDTKAYFIGPAEAGTGEAGMAAICLTNGQILGYVSSDESDLEIEPDIKFGKISVRDVAESFSKEGEKKKDPLASWRGPAGIHLGDLKRQKGRSLNLETGAIVDNDFRKEFKKKYGDHVDMGTYIAHIFNGAQVWYLHPNFGFQIWITLNKVVLATGDFPIEYKDASLGIYSACQWQSYTITEANKWDNVVMFTTNVKIMAAGGRAIRSSACGSPLEHCASVGPMFFAPGDISRGVSHEMAHTMGMPDDYTFPTGRICTTGLMRHHQEFQDWSRCSVQRFEQWLEVKGNRTSCLLRENTPSIPESRQPPKMPLNVAWRSRATLSSTKDKNEYLWGAWKAVDGTPTHTTPIEPQANISSCARTEKETDPWLRVKLPDDFLGTPLETVRIIFPQIKGGIDMKNIEVRAGKSKDYNKQEVCYPLEATDKTKYGRTLNLKCNHEHDWMARYVTVKKKGKSEVLTVCEVYAFKKLNVKDFKKPDTECLNEDPLCWDWMRNCHESDDVRWKCPYTCGDCKNGKRTFKPKKKPKGRRKWAKGCKDRNGKFCRKMKEKGKCKSNLAQKMCKTTCGSCDKKNKGPQATEGPAVTHAPGCKDQSERGCAMWAAAGYCKRGRVKKKCKASCNLC